MLWIDSYILEELFKFLESCNLCLVEVDDFNWAISLSVYSVKLTFTVYVICYLPF